VKTIKRLVDAWSAAERALLATVYGKASIVGSYACRDVRDGAGRSLHAFRLAPDIDPGLNRRQGSGRGWIGEVLTHPRESAGGGDDSDPLRCPGVPQRGRVQGPGPLQFQIACRKARIAASVTNDVAGEKAHSSAMLSIQVIMSTTYR
jgi:hypothetical protein